MPRQESRHIKSIVGANVRRVRKEMQLTQLQFAVHAGVDPMSVSRWERGLVLPDVESLCALSAASGRDVQWFLTNDADEDVDSELAA